MSKLSSVVSTHIHSSCDKDLCSITCFKYTVVNIILYENVIPGVPHTPTERGSGI